MKNVLVINAGSSSLKYQLIDMTNEDVLAKGLVERIGLPGAKLTHKPTGKAQEKYIFEADMPDHHVAIDLVIKILTDEQCGVISDMSAISAVGHRVVHGGENFTSSVKIDDAVLSAIRECIDLAPLHNPANIMGIEACAAVMPGVPMCGVFDTAFHQTMPDYSYLYAIAYEDYEQYKIRRYGFHGTSHKYVSDKAAEVLGKDISELKIITCHLGNGSSVAAVDCGKSVDTSMGLTPLEGLIMGTRSGDLDPSIVTFLAAKKGIDAVKVVDYLSKKCGVAGISGVSSDFRDLWDAANAGNARAKLALEMFTYRIKKYIGAYAAAMGGVDAIVFAGGIGENDHDIRKMSTAGLEYMGVKIDDEQNDGVRGTQKCISTADSKVAVWIIPTDEEMVIARDTAGVCG